MAQARDAYEVLGIAKDATADQIKKAYRKLAREHHPDRTGGDDTKFKEINAAHAVLSDDDKRKLYDEFGYAAFRPGFDAAQARAFGGAFRGGPGGGGIDLDDLIKSMFGGGGGGSFSFEFGGPGGGFQQPRGGPMGGGAFGRRAYSRGPRRGQDIKVPTQVSLVEAISGTEASFMLPTGNKVKVRIPQGVRTGSKVRLRGKGGPGVEGGPAGDVLLEIEVLEHPYVRVDRDDLEMDVPLTFAESLLGGAITVPTPTGTVKVKIPPGAGNGTRMRLRGRGLPKGGKDTSEGDLYLVLRPSPPPVEGKDLDALAGQLAELYDISPRDDLDFG